MTNSDRSLCWFFSPQNLNKLEMTVGKLRHKCEIDVNYVSSVTSLII